MRLPAVHPRGSQLVIAAIVAASAGAVDADPWKTSIDVTLRKKPGERQAVVAKLPAGTEVVIVKEEGRWLKVRAGKHVGYLTRTTVDDAGAVATPSPTPTSPVAPTPAPTVEPKEPGGPKGQWSQARRDTGGSLEGSGAPAPELRGVTGPVDTTSTTKRDERAPRPTFERAPRFVRTGAGVGYRSIGMDFSSDGTAGLSNYLVAADALAVQLDADVVKRFGALRVGVDVRGQVGTSAPGTGIDYQGPSQPSGEIPFRTVGVDAGVRAGASVHRLFELSARVGGHYDAFLPVEVANAGRLAREHLIGVVAGALVDIVPPDSRMTASLHVDALVFGSRDQTKGLEDGESSRAHAVWAGASIRIALGRRLSLVTSIDLARLSTDWTGMSARAPGVTRAERVDTSQLFQLGVGADL